MEYQEHHGLYHCFQFWYFHVSLYDIYIYQYMFLQLFFYYQRRKEQEWELLKRQTQEKCSWIPFQDVRISLLALVMTISIILIAVIWFAREEMRMQLMVTATPSVKWQFVVWLSLICAHMWHHWSQSNFIRVGLDYCVFNFMNIPSLWSHRGYKTLNKPLYIYQVINTK